MGGAADRAAGASVSGHLLERDRELRVLKRAIADAATGTAELVLIEGPAGIGKSRLVAEARVTAAASGLTVLAARGSELERDFPFGVVRQLLEPRLADIASRKRILSGAANATGPIFDLPGAQGELGAESTFAALHGLYWMVVNLSADGPLLIAIDDLHWSDRASLRFLGYLARRLEGLPVLVVAGLRPSGPGAAEARRA